MEDRTGKHQTKQDKTRQNLTPETDSGDEDEDTCIANRVGYQDTKTQIPGLEFLGWMNNQDDICVKRQRLADRCLADRFDDTPKFTYSLTLTLNPQPSTLNNNPKPNSVEEKLSRLITTGLAPKLLDMFAKVSQSCSPTNSQILNLCSPEPL
jgi:hypothetical protein